MRSHEASSRRSAAPIIWERWRSSRLDIGRSVRGGRSRFLRFTTMRRRSPIKAEEKRRNSAATMKDIAAHANVSIGTVSRVLNRHTDVDKELRTRVEAAVRKLGYRLNARTRSVVHTRSRIVGLIQCNDFGLNA